MLFTVLERILLLDILPAQGDFQSLRIIRELQQELSFSEEENIILQFEREDGRIKWLAEGNVDKEVAIGKLAKQLITDRLKKMDTDKSLGMDHIGLYERFVDDE